MVALSTIVQQPAGMLGSMHRLGVGNVMGKLTTTMAQPWTWLDHARFINTRSVFMRNRTRMSQRDIREMVRELNSQGHVDTVNLLISGDARQKVAALAQIRNLIGRYAFFPMAFVDKWASSIPWTVAYENAIAGRVEGVDPQSEAEAIAYADHIIRTTFGSGRPEDLPPVMRASELSKLLTPMFSYFNVQYNQLWNEQVPGMMRGRVSVMEFVTFFALTFVVQALVSEWAAGRWHDDDESEEEQRARLGSVVAAAPFAGIPIIRDIARGVSYQVATGRPARGDIVPAFGAITSTQQAVGGTIEAVNEGEEIDRATMRAIVLSSGYWFGYPSRQTWITGEYAYDVATGEEPSPIEDPLRAYQEGLLRDTQ